MRRRRLRRRRFTRRTLFRIVHAQGAILNEARTTRCRATPARRLRRRRRRRRRRVHAWNLETCGGGVRLIDRRRRTFHDEMFKRRRQWALG